MLHKQNKISPFNNIGKVLDRGKEKSFSLFHIENVAKKLHQLYLLSLGQGLSKVIHGHFFK